MNRTSWLVVPALLLFAGNASAQRVRLDDSLSPAATLHIALAWDFDALLRAAASPSLDVEPPPATGRLPGVDVRLDTHEFVGQQVRIFVSLAGLPESANVELRWDTNGRFLPGTVRPGQSALVYEGAVEQPITSAIFSFVLLVREDGMTQDDLEVIYELEALP